MADRLILNFGGTIYEHGYGLLAKKVMTDPSISINAKALYAYIISFAGTTETAWPGRTKICNDLGLSKERFSKCLKELVSAGFILAERERGEKGRLGGYIYTVVVVVEKNVDKSTSSPCLGNPDMDNQDLVHPDLEKPDNNNNNKIYKINRIKNNNNNSNQEMGYVPVGKRGGVVVSPISNNRTNTNEESQTIRKSREENGSHLSGVPEKSGCAGVNTNSYPDLRIDKTAGASRRFSANNRKLSALAKLDEVTKAEVERVRNIFSSRGMPVAINGSSVEALVEWTKCTDEELVSVIEQIQQLAEAGEVDNPAGLLVAGPNIVGDVLKGRKVVGKTKSRAGVSFEDWGTGW
ncbi:MAG: helix-turn-helix domain-containing protein [Peptococcaceae bacterium]|jgi:hypothetical protein|nr:helix-turn-helix domain-containing protein [Peptococcaceae bacterium]